MSASIKQLYTISSSVITPSEPESKEIVQIPSIKNKTIKHVFMEKFLHFTEDYTKRIKGYHEDPDCLKQGVFYANEHFLALKKVLPIIKERISLLQNEYREAIKRHRQCIEKGSHHIPEADTAKRLFAEKKQLEKTSSDLERIQTLVFKSASYYHGLIPRSCGARRIKNQREITGFLPNAYSLKQDTKPSLFLKNITTGLTFLCCASTISIAQYQTLLSVWGEEKFNAIFESNKSKKYFFNYRSQYFPLIPFLHQHEQQDSTGEGPNRRNISVGSIYYIQGIEKYHEKHRNGEAQGFNIMCVSADPGNQKFTGFGLPKEGATEEEILQIIVDEYNRDPVDLSILPEKYHANFSYNPNIEKLRTDKISMEEFKRLGGGAFIQVPISFNTEKINSIKELPLEEVKAFVASL
jgi:hypothetical protein